MSLHKCKAMIINLFYELITFLIYYSGLFFVLRRLLKDKSIILMYHSINKINYPYIFPDNIISIENFEKQLLYLKRNFNIISLNKLVSYLKKM